MCRIGLDHFALPGRQPGDRGRNRRPQAELPGLHDRPGAHPAGCRIDLDRPHTRRLCPEHQRDRRHGRAPSAPERYPSRRAMPSTAEDRLRGHIIEQLMCFGESGHSDGARAFPFPGIHFAEEFDELSSYAREGVVSLDNGIVRISDDARSLVRVVASVFRFISQEADRPAFDRRLEPASFDRPCCCGKREQSRLARAAAAAEMWLGD